MRFGNDDGHSSYVTGLTLAGSVLVSCSYDRQLIWWDVADRRVIRKVAAHDRWIRRVVAMPDGKRIVSVSDDMLAKVWDIETGELIGQ